MLLKLAVILIGVMLISAVFENWERQGTPEPWYLATAQKLTHEGIRVYAERNVVERKMLFETPRLNRKIALGMVKSGDFAINAISSGYRAFEFTSGKSTWVYDLERETMKP